MHLLDSNVWITYLRGKDPQLRARFAACPQSEIAICSVVLGELKNGALRSAKPVQNALAIETLTDPFVCFPYDKSTTKIFAEIRFHLERAGTPIGPYDLQIAAIALERQCTVVTHNVSEFRRVPGLIVEDWQTP
jgi:tRNA(fMet)-specific endonuclease VapC